MHSGWNYRVYIPSDLRFYEKDNPAIVRLAPSENSLEGEGINLEASSMVFYAERESTEYKEVKIEQGKFFIDNLKPDFEYKLFIKNSDEKVSKERFFRTGYVQGKVVNYLHPDDECYSFSGRCLCSPSIVKLPSGKIITSMDVYAGKNPQNLTLLMQSNDNGETFEYLNDIFPLFWGKLFYQNNVLYLLGTSTEYGDLIIGKSEDEGVTWSEPTVLDRGSCSFNGQGFHRAPTVVINENGKIITSVEYGCGKIKYSNALLFADANAPLTDKKSWTMSPFWSHERDENAEVAVQRGGFEGNCVIAPDGKLINFLRHTEGKALLLQADINCLEKGFKFHSLIDFPLGHTKFEIQKKGDTYYAIGNIPEGRKVLSLYTSKDLMGWKFDRDIVNFKEMDKEKVGYQYPAFVFDDDEILLLSRTAFNNAHNFHDTNYQTFYKIKL